MDYMPALMRKIIYVNGLHLPRVPITRYLPFSQRDNEIVVGTHGRSAYVAKLKMFKRHLQK
jgi:hypothetical protein